LVADILRETRLDPSLLELEFTESDLLTHADTLAERLRELKALGLFISVDNFGTGYSSLAYLKRLPIDALKIDRSFIRDIHLGGDEAAISRAVIALSRSLNLRVVAEGVETVEQAESLRTERWCDLQGFYFSRPVNVDEATQLLDLANGGADSHAC
jgi:EAL domain-containing protein (putative c-di-GMP-specific phosphodiesterase class I)